MITEQPTRVEYDRYFELGNSQMELTPAEEAEERKLGARVRPWCFSIESRILAIESPSLISVPKTTEEGATYEQWITKHFAVIPEHWIRWIDKKARLQWAILPFDEQPVNASALTYRDGQFQRVDPKLFDWDFHVWIYHSIQARRAYERHFGSEFPTSDYVGDEEIDSWIDRLNDADALSEPFRSGGFTLEAREPVSPYPSVD